MMMMSYPSHRQECSRALLLPVTLSPLTLCACLATNPDKNRKVNKAKHKACLDPGDDAIDLQHEENHGCRQNEPAIVLRIDKREYLDTSPPPLMEIFKRRYSE
jgi:hypothetical protein